MNYLELAEKAGVNLALATPSYKEFLILYGDLVAKQKCKEIADKIAKLPFGDTAESFALWIREQA